MVDLDAFERRVCHVDDLDVDWRYWNALLPETTGYALWMLWLWPALRDAKRVRAVIDRDDRAMGR